MQPIDAADGSKIPHQHCLVKMMRQTKKLSTINLSIVATALDFSTINKDQQNTRIPSRERVHIPPNGKATKH